MLLPPQFLQSVGLNFVGSSVTTFVLRRLTRAGGVFDATSKLTSCEVVERYYPKIHLLAISRADELYGLTFLPTRPKKEDRPQSTRARLWNTAHENAFKKPKRPKVSYLMRPLRMFASNGPRIAQPEVPSDLLGVESRDGGGCELNKELAFGVASVPACPS